MFCSLQFWPNNIYCRGANLRRGYVCGASFWCRNISRSSDIRRFRHGGRGI